MNQIEIGSSEWVEISIMVLRCPDVEDYTHFIHNHSRYDSIVLRGHVAWRSKTLSTPVNLVIQAYSLLW